ncbi:AsmA-like C-terminal region-containing protein [Terasakiella sp. A23]|uniref:AsmA family protein n=1 Tax=Terasakiella sp. FCG-A23 TaxID=3080561 RepID=UPI002953C3A1|nr:AsmA-like C-terminal region-containing protein [Terasakiella sp. A23]MDV7338787.1 AsmA-like C-terminal region-containing protein [Terasakiella sp. A23]
MLHLEGLSFSWIKSKIITIIGFILVVLIATPFFLPSSVYQGLIEKRLEKSTGLDFQFRGPFTFKLFPSILLEADNVDFYGTVVGEVETLGSFQELRLEMDGLSFLAGDIHIDEFFLHNPKVTINGDFTPFLPEIIRSNLSASRKEDIRYLEIMLHFIEDSVFDMAKISDGTLQWNKSEHNVISAQKIEAIVKKPEAGKDFTVKSNAYINNRSIDLNMRLQRPDDFLRGFRSKLSMQVDSAPIKIDFQGNAAHRQSFVAQGDVRLDIPSVYDFCTWFEKRENCDDSSENILIKSHLNLRDQRLQFEDAIYTHNPFQLNATGAIDFKYALPIISGTIHVPPQPISTLSPLFKKAQTIDFKKFFLDAFDANVDIKYQGLEFLTGQTISPNVKVNVNDGRLTISSEQIDILGGIGNVRLRWNEGIDKGFMDMRMDARGLSIKELSKAVGMNLQTSGALNYFFEVQSQGHEVSQFIETARVHGEFTILDGMLTNKDVIQSLNGKAIRMFEFAEIKGHLKGDRGQIVSDDIKFVAPFVDIQGLASVNFLDQSIKVQLNSTIPARGENPDKAPQEGFITISGPWDKLELYTSSNAKTPVQPEKGLHSGLITNENSSNEELVVEETDLLD